MTEAEEKKLWKSLKLDGDEYAREQLVIEYMRVVRYIAGRMAIHVPNHVDMDDLVGWGVLGLLDAIGKFDHTQEVKFSTYSSIRIRGSIIDQIRTLDWAPRSLRSTARKVAVVRDKMRQQKGSEPTNEELAEELGIEPEQVEDTMAQLQTAQVLSLDDYLPSEDTSGTRKLDIVSNSSALNPMKVAEANERQEMLVHAILKLPDQQQKVLNLYYYEELTLKEIGLVLGVSESRVCQVHSASMKRLRKVLQGDE